MSNMSSLLTLEDVQNINVDSNQTRFGILVRVAAVAYEKLKREQQQESLLRISAENTTNNNPPMSDEASDSAKHEDNLEKESSQRKKNSTIKRKESPLPSSRKKNNSRKRRKMALQPPSLDINWPPPAAASPTEFEKKIHAMGGTEVHVIIEKKLSKTDITKEQDRLLMPLRQLKKQDFVTDEELQEILQKDEKGKTKGLEVPLIQPDLGVDKLFLTRWDTTKESGSVYSPFVLRAFWKKVVRIHYLQENDVIQVWSFRVRQRLHLALVKLVEE